MTIKTETTWEIIAQDLHNVLVDVVSAYSLVVCVCKPNRRKCLNCRILEARAQFEIKDETQVVNHE